MRFVPVALLLATSCAIAQPAAAATITFTGTVLNTCILTLSTPGTLGTSADGTRLSSQDGLGLPAILAVIATGAAPKLLFTAPTIAGASSSGSTVAMSYASASGINQDYTSAAYTAQAGSLLDTVTINARAINNTGFASGLYTISSTVTCQQQ